MKSEILSLHGKLINNEIAINELINQSKLKYQKNISNNDVITPTYESAIEQAKEYQELISQNHNNLLFGIPYTLKDNISTSNIKTTGGSKFLDNYFPPFDATVFTLLKKANGILVSKTNCDEFGMGGTGLSSGYGYVHNVFNHQRIVGGSSSGGANQVANGVVSFAITSDTGDSIRRPASFVGEVGFKPTYGSISRYGVFPYAPSLDCVGINAKTVSDCAIVAQNVVKFDDKDSTSIHVKENEFFNNLTTLKNIHINVISGIDAYLNKEVIDAYHKAIDILKRNGCIIKEVNIAQDILAIILPTYMTISYGESSSCYANLTGINFGLNVGGNSYQEMILKNRSKGIGKEVIRRLVIGELLTNKENFHSIFMHAKRVRTLLINTYNELIKDGDCLLLPGASSIAPLIEDVINKKFKTTYADDLLTLANFAGAPSITIPFTKINDMPFGLNINCLAFQDQKALNIAYSLESIFENNGGENE